MRLLRKALEELSPEVDPTPVKEIEYVFYGKIKDFDQLKAAVAVEHQEQYEIKIPKTDDNAIEGKVRIRKTVVQGQDTPSYVLTTKTKTADGNNIEVPCETTEKMLIQFRYLASHGMIKDRYSFAVPGLEDTFWEVDVFKAPNGQYHEWCKIDLEVDEKTGEIPALPIELDNLITSPYGQRTEEEEATVRTLYDTVFRVPNPHK